MVFIPPVYKRFTQGVLDCPPKFTETVNDYAYVDALDARPFTDGVSCAKRGKASVSSRVIGLGSGCSPFTIFRRVRPIVIFAIYGMLRAWCWPHIFYKTSCGMQPPFADCNSSCSVVPIAWVARVKTTLSHVFPDSVFPCAFQSVNKVSRCRAFPLQASTALRVPRLQLFGGKDFKLATVASTVPKDAFTALRVALKDQQSSKLLTSQVYVYSHSVSLPRQWGLMNHSGAALAASGNTAKWYGIYSTSL